MNDTYWRRRPVSQSSGKGAVSGGAGGAVSGAYGYARQPGPHSVTGFVGHTALSAAAGGSMGAARQPPWRPVTASAERVALHPMTGDLVVQGGSNAHVFGSVHD